MLKYLASVFPNSTILSRLASFDELTMPLLVVFIHVHKFDPTNIDEHGMSFKDHLVNVSDL
jgi:hypothetical protein